MGMVVIAMAGISLTRPVMHNYEGTDSLVHPFPFPEFLESPTVTMSRLPGGRGEVKLTFSQPIVPGKDCLEVEAFFDSNPNTTTIFDRGVIAALGAYTYHSKPNILPGTAGVVAIDGFKKEADASVEVSGCSITLRYRLKDVNFAPCNLVNVRWIPASIPITSVIGDLNGVLGTMRVFRSHAASQVHFGLPRVPNQFIRLDGSLYWG